MAHDRKIVLGGVSLTPARLNRTMYQVSVEVMNEVETLMQESGYLEQAPFQWVGIVFRYGLRNEEEPHYKPIDAKDGELPLAIELDTRDIRSARPEELRRKVTLVALKSLIHAGKKFGLPTADLEARLGQLQSSGDGLTP